MHELGDFDETPEFDSHIENLRESSRDAMMNMIYNAVINEEDKAIAADTPTDQKLEALNNVIKYFVETEEYEKCYNIKKIIDKIKC